MRRYDARHVHVEDYRALMRLLRRNRKLIAYLTVTPIPNWPRTIDIADQPRRAVRFQTIN